MTAAPDEDFVAGLMGQFLELFVARLKDEGLVHDDRPLLSLPEVAKRLGLGDRTVGEMLESRDGQPPRLASIVVNKVTRKVEPRELDRYLEQQRRASWMAAGRDTP